MSTKYIRRKDGVLVPEGFRATQNDLVNEIAKKVVFGTDAFLKEVFGLILPSIIMDIFENFPDNQNRSWNRELLNQLGLEIKQTEMQNPETSLNGIRTSVFLKQSLNK